MSKHQLVFFSVLLALLFCWDPAFGQRSRARSDDEFGPVVQAYLGYLHNEQEVVDDRVSRREISAAYYRRNSNRIHALRQIAIRIARESHNDYLPELEAVARDEFGDIFEHPPQMTTLRMGAVLNNTFRYLGVVRANEVFYVFARLDPYEQADLIRKEKATSSSATKTDSAPNGHEASGSAHSAGPP
jgi:hypothetical protein